MSKGFTLIEMLVVLVILGSLMGIAAPQIAGRGEQARLQAAEADVKSAIALALDLYEVDLGRYPGTLQELITNKTGKRAWQGPYLKNGMPADPWENAYVYRYPGIWNAGTYDLYSLGPDGQENTGDEITNEPAL